MGITEKERERGKEKRKVSPLLAPALLRPAQRPASGGRARLRLPFALFYHIPATPSDGCSHS